MRKHGVFIAFLLLCMGLCFASGLLKPAELLISSTLFIAFWVFRNRFKTRKNIFTNLLLACFAALFTLTLADISYHIYLNKKPNGERIESEVETIYKFRPNQVISDSARYGDLAEMGMLTKLFPETRKIICQIDELGYRNPIGQKNKKNRIILIGDSFGFGAMTDGENIADFLRNDFGLETYNLSLPGYGPWQEHYTLREEIDKITKADTCTVVWLLFTGNDLAGRFDSVNVADRKANWRDDFYSFRKKSPIREGLTRVFNPKALADTNVFAQDGRLFYTPYLREEERDSLRNEKVFLQTVDKVVGLCGKKRVGLKIMAIPAKEALLDRSTKVRSRMNAWRAITHHIQNRVLIDFPCVAFDYPDTNWLFYQKNYLIGDTHLNQWGNKKVAYQINDLLFPSSPILPAK